MRLSTVHAAVKLVLLAAISSTALFSRSVFQLALIWLLVLLILLAGRVGPDKLWRQGRMAAGFITGIFIIQLIFTRGGVPLLSPGGFVLITQGGLHLAALVSLRLLIIVSSALIVLTGEERDYLLVLTALRLPYEIAYMVLAALRFIPLLKAEAEAVNQAMQMRGLNIKKAPLAQKARIYLSMLLPVTVQAIERAEQMATAMEARAFRAFPRRTQWRHLPFLRHDWIFLIIFLLIIVLIIVYGATR
jgi:energy-coupling factor transport system permease protein